MRTDDTLKQLLVAELCAIVEGWDQYWAAAVLGLHQSQVSALRNGRTAGFSSDRLIRLITSSGYHVEVMFREMPQRFAKPAVDPTVTVQRIESVRTHSEASRARSGEAVHEYFRGARDS